MPNGGRTVFCHIAVLDSFQLNTLGPLWPASSPAGHSAEMCMALSMLRP
uniref:Uncharacterized protein n=1 Tax=Methylophaga nitratireducenticrescens TaxID=754476 RepID=I1XFH7_METNJ